MRIGILGLQGAVSEHIGAFERAFAASNTPGKAFWLRDREGLDNIDALVLPGGESSTISAQLARLGMDEGIRELANDGLPIMGTCAGTILLAKELEGRGDEKARPLGLMDITVERNAFGRQRESFETDVEIEGLDTPYRAVFIRAPIITRVGENASVLSNLDDRIIMARQGNMLAMVFHPELTHDMRVHAMFIKMII